MHHKWDEFDIWWALKIQTGLVNIKLALFFKIKLGASPLQTAYLCALSLSDDICIFFVFSELQIKSSDWLKLVFWWPVGHKWLPGYMHSVMGNNFSGKAHKRGLPSFFYAIAVTNLKRARLYTRSNNKSSMTCLKDWDPHQWRIVKFVIVQQSLHYL